jgi:hypothetical protein
VVVVVHERRERLSASANALLSGGEGDGGIGGMGDGAELKAETGEGLRGKCRKGQGEGSIRFRGNAAVYFQVVGIGEETAVLFAGSLFT